jgi:hypothetical protein
MTPSSSGRIAFFHDAYTGSIPVGVNKIIKKQPRF